MLFRRLCLIAFIFLLGSCQPAAQGQSPARHPITYGLTLQPSGIDPHINASSELGIAMRQVYDTLVYRDPTTRDFVPGLATQWTISDDGLTYTFTLRQGVKFHDGTPFNAQAVGANLDRITSPQIASQKAIFMLGTYLNYEIVDNYTIRLHLSAPYSPLLDSLSQVYLGIASPTAFNQVSPERYQFHQIGTGPFILTDYVPGDHITLRRNPDYTWGPSFYQPPSDNSVDEITFRFFTDPATRSPALENGDAQVMGELLPTDGKALTGNSEIQLLPTSVPGQPLQFMMNTARFPTDNLQVRQAILYGTNREAIRDAVFQSFSPVAWGPLSANTLFYTTRMQGLYAHDTSQAQTLLTNAGFQDSDNNGYLDAPGGGDLSLNVIVPPWGEIPSVAQLLQDEWRTLGIKAVLDPVPTFTGLREKVSTGEYNLVAYYTFGFDPAFLSDFYTSTGAYNWTGYHDPILDTMLQQAAEKTDLTERAILYVQAQQLIMDQALILPIRDYVNLNGSRGLQGLTFDPYGWFPILNNVTVSP